MARDHVDPNEILPKYYQLYQIIKQKIDDGVWLPHQTIPAERELEEIYNVSRTTVRKTLDLLVNRRHPFQGIRKRNVCISSETAVYRA